MKISVEMVDYVSILARLNLPEAEKRQMAGDLEQILAYMDVLDTLDTAETEFFHRPSSLQNVLRTDTVEPSFDRERLLEGAPARDSASFFVPKAVE